MKYFPTLFIAFIFSTTAFSQDKVNEIAKLVCDCITEHKKDMDSTIMQYCFTKAFRNVDGLPAGQNKMEKLAEKVHFKLTKDCADYLLAVNMVDPGKGDWKVAGNDTTSKLAKTECRRIEQSPGLYYLEHNGDTTYVTIKNGLWQDNFTDKKYSQCKFSWVNDCDFELEFIKATEDSRKKLSKKGDKYYYRVISRAADHYLLLARTGNSWQEFKLYF